MNKKVHYLGMDVHKESIEIAIAVEGGELRRYGKIGGTVAALDKAIGRLKQPGVELRFVYEAGPTGYVIYRHLKKLGYPCVVVAPSLTPRKSGQRIKTDRRDAETLARLFRAGELTPIHVPTEEDEAVRDLVRCRLAAIKDQRRARQRVKGLLLRLGFRYEGKSNWREAHLRSLAKLKMPSPAQQIAFQEYVQAVTVSTEQVERLTRVMEEQALHWRWYPVVKALMTLRGMQRINAMTLVAELGDLRRFDNPRPLMGYLGLIPSEHTTGPRRFQGSITKTGNESCRRALVEAAWHYRLPARLSPSLQKRQEGQSAAVRAIAWKAQQRLCGRYRTLVSRGKRGQIVVTALARELSGFVWAIFREAAGGATAADRVPAGRGRSSAPSSSPARRNYVLKKV